MPTSVKWHDMTRKAAAFHFNHFDRNGMHGFHFLLKKKNKSAFLFPKCFSCLFFFLKIFFFFFFCFQMWTYGPSFEISFSDLGCGVCRSLRVDLKLVAPCPCSMGKPLCLTVCLLFGGWNNALSCACREKGQKPLQLHW